MVLSLRFDILVEVISLLTCLLITGFSLYAYHRTRAPRHLAFASAFAFIAIGSIGSITFHWLVQLEVMRIPVRGFLAIPPLFDLFRFLSQLFSMAGYLLLFMITERIASLKTGLVVLLVAPLTALVAHEVFSVYHAVAVMVLAFCFHHFYCSFLETGSRNSRNIAFGFALLILSEISFVFVVMNIGFYHAAHVLRLGGFLTLLYTLGRIYALSESVSAATVASRSVKQRRG